MKLKEIAAAVEHYAPEFTCKTQPRKHQIILQSKEETILLLSPYYQQRIAEDRFNEADLAAILVEVDRIIRYGC